MTVNWRSRTACRAERRQGRALLHDTRMLNLVYGGLNSSGTTPMPQAHFNAIRALGATGVRVGPRWNHIEPTLGAGIDTTKILTVVRRAAAAGLQVEIELHHTGTSSFPAGASTAVMLDTVRDDSLAAVRSLAKIAVSEQNVIAVGTANEITDTSLANTIVGVNLTLEREIRRAGWDGIVLGMVLAGQNTNGGSWAPFIDAHPLNMCEVHWYFGGGHADGFGSVQASGGRFASQGIYVDDGVTALGAATAAQFQAHMQRWFNMPGVHPKKVWVGEWGIGLDLAGAAKFVDLLRAEMRARGIGHAWWRNVDAGSKMAIFRTGDSTGPHALARQIFAP